MPNDPRYPWWKQILNAPRMPSDDYDLAPKDLGLALQGIGIEPGSVLWRTAVTPGEITAKTAASVDPKGIWRGLAKAPEPPSADYPPAPMQDPPLGMPGSFPAGRPVNAMPTSVWQDPKRPTIMEWEWGSKGAPSEAELAEQRANFLSRPDTVQKAMQNYIPTMQLEEMAYRSPNSQVLQHMVKERLGGMTAERQLAENRAKTMSETETELHPSVLALRELQAGREPQARYGQALVEQAVPGAEARMYQTEVESFMADEEQRRKMKVDLLTAKAELLGSEYYDSDDPEVQKWLRTIDAILMGLDQAQ